jgi:ParB family chromosome partitioning protein
MPKEIKRFRIRDIKVVGKRRPLNPNKVKVIADSMRTIGLKNPITVCVRKGDLVELVAGLHRLEAAKLIGEKRIDCIVIRGGKLQRRLWQNAENLHRAGLTQLQRAEGIAQCTRDAIRLTEKKGDTALKGGKQPGDKGLSKGARKLGFPRETIRRAIEIDRLSPEAKKAAKRRGLDRNQDALLKAAKESTADAQVRKVRELTTRREPVELTSTEQKQLDQLEQRLMKAKNLRKALSKASPAVRRKFAATITKLDHSRA